MKGKGILVLALCALALAGCQSTESTSVFMSKKGAVELRAMQSRVFDTGDRAKVMRASIATLQDLGYGIEKVETAAGSVKARKLGELEISISIFPRGQAQTIVRANAMVRTPDGNSQVDEPLFYQQRFFEPLSKALFLTALNEPVADSAAEPGALKPVTN